MALSQTAQQALANATKQQLDALNNALKPQIEDLMRVHMGNLIRKVIAATPPFEGHGNRGTGGRPKGALTGIQNIKSDLKKVFSTVRSVPFKQLVANRDWEAMAAYGMKFRNPELERAFNEKRIDPLNEAFVRKFTVLANTDMFIKENEMSKTYSMFRKNGVLKPPTTQKFLVKNNNVINDRARDVARGIGKMVGGWHMAASQLGIKGINKSPFSGNASGSGELKSAGDKYSMTVTNDYGDFGHILSSSIDCQKLINDTAHDLESDVQMLVESEINRVLSTGKQSPRPLPQPPRLNPASMGKRGNTPNQPRPNPGAGRKP